MKAPHSRPFLILLLVLYSIEDLSIEVNGIQTLQDGSHRRTLHQPLYPSPPEAGPPPESLDFTDPDPVLFSDSPNISPPLLAANHPTKPSKVLKILIPAGVVSLVLLSALTFIACQHTVKLLRDSQKPVGVSSRLFRQETRGPDSDLLHLGTMETPSRYTYSNSSSVQTLELKWPSPELQPLPPLSRTASRNSPLAVSSEEESQETFHTPRGSAAGNHDVLYTSFRFEIFPPTSNPESIAQSASHFTNSIPHPQKNSPNSHSSVSSPDNDPVLIAKSASQFINSIPQKISPNSHSSVSSP